MSVINKSRTIPGTFACSSCCFKVAVHLAKARKSSGRARARTYSRGTWSLWLQENSLLLRRGILCFAYGFCSCARSPSTCEGCHLRGVQARTVRSDAFDFSVDFLEVAGNSDKKRFRERTIPVHPRRYVPVLLIPSDLNSKLFSWALRRAHCAKSH
jgi:hypothetical protein